MEDRNTELLSRYGIKALKTGRLRGAVMIQAEEGMYLLREFNGNEKHLEFEEKLLRDIASSGSLHVDYLIRNIEGELIDREENGKKYLLRRWYPAVDCDAKNTRHMLWAARTLAKLHNLMNLSGCDQKMIQSVFDPEEEIKRLQGEFDKHTIELKRTRNYIRSKRRKNQFELMVLKEFDHFFDDAKEAQEMLAEPVMQQFVEKEIGQGRLVHGAYNYHNVLVEEPSKGAVGEVCPFVTNFEKTKCSVQIRDFYDFLRKVMEKHSWEPGLGKALLKEYAAVRPVSPEEYRYLALKLKYPEKYWKLLNHYYNSNKAWVPDKDIAKLEVVMKQRNGREKFVESL